MNASYSLLVQYGRTAFVGVFTSNEPLRAERGSTVVVRTPRGLELGTVLCEPNAGYAALAEAGGDFIRLAAHNDSTSEAQRLELLEAAQRQLEAEPVVVLDAELLFDGTNAILHVLPWADCNLDDALETLSREFLLTIKALDHNRLPKLADQPEKSSCGSGGCGTKEGGCSTGGCSSGSCSRSQVKSADDLTAYFADLRMKMEADTAGRTNLV